MPPIRGPPKQCLICYRKFSKTEHLERHRRSHTKEKPFQCKQCNRSYTRHDTLLRHQRAHAELIAQSQPVTSTELPVNCNLDESGVRLQHGNKDDDSLALPTPTASSSLHPFSIRSDASNHVDMRVLEGNVFTQPLNNTDPANAQQNSPCPQTGLLATRLPQEDNCGPTHLSAAMQLPLSFNDGDPFFDTQIPSWFLHADFDLGMLSSPLVAPLADGPLEWSYNPPEMHNFGEITAPNVQQIWFTKLRGPQHSELASGAVTPTNAPETAIVDEEFRRTLHHRLQPRVRNRQLPSPDFLNLCVRMFFAHVNPVFPVIHAPTFRPSAKTSSLLLSICSIGSLFTGSGNAAEHGIHIFEQLNKAVMAGPNLWDRLVTCETSEVITIVATALIGQLFGLLSGYAEHLALVDSYHGMLISWARRIKVFEVRQQVVLLEDLEGENLEETWRKWVTNEELVRINLALHVHDAELTGIFRHEGTLRHSLRRLPHCASEELFSAPCAKDWASSYRKTLQQHSNTSTGPSLNQGFVSDEAIIQSIPVAADMTVYAALEGIGATVVELRVMQEFDEEERVRVSRALTHIYQTHLKRPLQGTNDRFGMVVLWHLTFMSLYVDLDLLERAVGRDGPAIHARDVASITQWAASAEAKRCVAHASMIYLTLKKMPIGSEPAVHVARAMFLAGLSWYCLIHYSPKQDFEEPSDDLLDFPEFRLTRVNPVVLLREWNGVRLEKARSVGASGTLGGLIDLLKRVGHWEIARKFASILLSLVQQEKK